MVDGPADAEADGPADSVIGIGTEADVEGQTDAEVEATGGSGGGAILSVCAFLARVRSPWGD